MRIKIDENHYLNSDPYCYWISCEVESETKKKYDKRVSGYCNTIEQAVHSYIDRQVLSSEAETLRTLAKDVAKLKKTVETWKVAIERGKQ